MEATMTGAGQLPMVVTLIYTLFLPPFDNEGSPQASELLLWAEEELARLGGGLTRYSPAHGLWVAPLANTPYREPIIPLQFAAPACPETEVRLIELMGEIARRFEQEEVFVVAQPVWLLTR